MENRQAKNRDNQQCRERFKTIDDFVDALRDPDNANHHWAREMVNDPTNQPYTVPVASYYLMARNDRRKGELTITWLRTPSLVADFEYATGRPVSSIHKNRSQEHVEARLGPEQLEWLKASDLYGADYELFERVSLETGNAAPARTNGAGELLTEPER